MNTNSVKLAVTEEKRGKLVQMNFSILKRMNYTVQIDSISYNIGCWATVRFRFVSQGANNITIASISFKKHDSQTEPNTQINITSSMGEQIRHFLCTEEWSDFIKMGEINFSTQLNWEFSGCKVEVCLYLATLVFSVHITEARSSLSYILHNDNTYLDFCLKPESGSGVPVHKVIMAAHSEVFKTMLSGEWKETSRDCLEVKGATQKTLQHLKDFMYLGSLPDDSDLRPLALIAKCYMMDRLEEACYEKLARTVKGEDLLDLVKFATDNGLYRLVVAILNNTSDKNINAMGTKAAEVQTK